MSRRIAQRLGAGAPLLPLAVLFAIELLDQAVQSAFNVLLPNVRDDFHLSDAGILLIVALAGAAALGCTLPVALLADRLRRVTIALVGAGIGAIFTLWLGLAPTAVLVAVALAGTSMGQAVIFPTHNSLLADYYPVAARPRVYSAHRAGISFGAIGGVLLGAGLASLWSWRAPFIALALPIVVVVLLGIRLREPRRGRHEQAALAGSPVGEDLRLDPAPVGEDGPGSDDGADDALPLDPPPSMGEAWRMVWKIAVLRRIFFALPFLAAAVVGFTSLASLQYQKTFHLDALQRAFLVAPVQVFDLVGLLVGALVATRVAARGVGRVFGMLGVAGGIAAGWSVVFALAPSAPVAFVANAGIDMSLAVVGPGVLATLSLVIPARARSVGFSVGALFVLPGLVVLPAIGALGDAIGFRYGMLLMVPVFVAGGLIVASGGSLVERDIRNVWTSMQARARMLAERRAGKLPLLAVRNLGVTYEGVAVLHGVSLEVAEAEIVALLGTNGAGKSTLLRSIGGVVEADGGAVIFDGRDITHTPPDEIARLGVAQVPGGESIFPTLTVEENLRAAAWQGSHRSADGDLGGALADFPVLQGRRGELARNLSGGQQQMLGLAMALLSAPKLLLVDELSLGLAPKVVQQLLVSLQELRLRGTAVLVVEQSVSVAVSTADRAYVLDNGAVAFAGTAADIRARPELLRSIYLKHAAARLPGLAKCADHHAPATRPTSGVTSSPNVLEVRDVSVGFGGIVALDRVSLHAGHGEIVGVIGPNGAGKTTLLDVISGFVRPASGRVLLDAEDVTHHTPAARARLGLGRSFQESRLFTDLTVREALSVALERFVDVADPFNAVLRLPALQITEAAVAERVEELVELFGLARLASNLMRELSTGSRRIVELAAVVASQPKVVLLDEPSSGVAQREVEALLGVLQSVRAQLDATFVVVEHSIAFVSQLSDRLVAFDGGAVVASGAPSAVLQGPEVAEAFLGRLGSEPAGGGSVVSPLEDAATPAGQGGR